MTGGGGDRGGLGREEAQDPEESRQGLPGAQGGAAPVHACPPGPGDTRAALTLMAGMPPACQALCGPQGVPQAVAHVTALSWWASWAAAPPRRPPPRHASPAAGVLRADSVFQSARARRSQAKSIKPASGKESFHAVSQSQKEQLGVTAAPAVCPAVSPGTSEALVPGGPSGRPEGSLMKGREKVFMACPLLQSTSRLGGRGKGPDSGVSLQSLTLSSQCVSAEAKQKDQI